MNKILVIDTAPFGMLIDVYKWTEYLSDEYDVRVICFKSRDGIEVKHKGIKLIEVPNSKVRVLKAIMFLVVCSYYLLLHRGLVILEYFEYCEIIKKIFPKRKILLDIRTLSVSPDKNIRLIKNHRIASTVKLFSHVSVISEGVANEVGCTWANILPLGADVISTNKKNYTDAMNILYVGTFTGRNIGQTVKAVISFIKKHPEIPITYTIIGYGTIDEVSEIEKLIENANMEHVIHFIGKVPHDQLTSYFDQSNIGFSFVPITDYYQNQPPTKTYEYCLSGLVTIATKTYSNVRLINEENGILVNDTADDIVVALETYWNKRYEYSEDAIRESLEGCTWENIVQHNLKTILRSL